jgi:hypothetical protein
VQARKSLSETVHIELNKKIIRHGNRLRSGCSASSDDCPSGKALKNSLLAATRPNEEFGIFYHVLNSGANPPERYWVVDKFLSIWSIIRPLVLEFFWAFVLNFLDCVAIKRVFLLGGKGLSENNHLERVWVMGDIKMSDSKHCIMFLSLGGTEDK